MRTDIAITGSMGFYQITARTSAGRSFMRRVDGAQDGSAFCDDTRMAQDIADGAAQDGLRVVVNGKEYRA